MTFIFCIFGFALLICGVILLLRGLWPLRVGDEPYCRVCGYLLIGWSGGRCPECGTELSDRNIVHGQRHRRAGLISAGIISLMLALTIIFSSIAGVIDHVNWELYKPSFLLIRELEPVLTASAGRAEQELESRDKTGELSAKYQ